MSTYVQTRDNARALLGAALTGSAVGLILAGAYFGGGMAQSRQVDTPAPAQDLSQPVAATADVVAATVNAGGVRSGAVLKASLVGPAAQPFHYAAARTATDLDCLTEAVYYEARGEGSAGEAAVAQVVLNRVRHPSFPKTICGVVFQGCQFSFTCNGAMRGRRETAAWNEARRIAGRALAGAVVANIGNATHFHTAGVNPGWGPNLLRVAQVGYHVFYRMGGRSGRPGAFTAQPQPSTDAPDATTQAVENAPVLASIVPSPAAGLTQAVFTSAPTTQKVQLVDPSTTALTKPVATTPVMVKTAPAVTQAAPVASKVEVSTSTAARPTQPTAATAS